MNDGSIVQRFKTNQPFCAGKLSTNILHLIKAVHDGRPCGGHVNHVCMDDGLFPTNETFVKMFCTEEYLGYFEDLDVCPLWHPHIQDFEKNLLIRRNPLVQTITLRELEPYYDPSNEWSRHLEGKKVLMISSKTKSIRAQYEKRDRIWTGKHSGLLPTFKELILLEFPECYYRTHESKQDPQVYGENSSALLESFKTKMDSIDFDVCLVGAGVYGVPLAVHAKRLGKIGIQMGGAIQLLFGIKGKRWENHSVISTFFNEHWVYPSDEEKPFKYATWEQGAYF